METIALLKLKKIVANRPAPRPDGRNLWIDIDVNFIKSTALIHCQDEENVGTDPGRMVTFRVDHDCLLVFSDERVFDLKSVQLPAYKQVALLVRDETNAVKTFYEIYAGTEAPTAAELANLVTRGGPHIVVP